MNYQGLSKKAFGVIMITAGFQAAGIALLGIVLFLALFFGAELKAAAFIAAAFFILLAVAFFIILPRFRHMRYKYYIGADRIEIIEGVIFVNRTIVPIDRIYQIDIARGPIDNAFGVAKVMLTTGGSTATFRFLELEKAEEIAEYLNAAIAEKISKGGRDADV